MTVDPSPLDPAQDAERLLQSLAGVVSAHVSGANGNIDEIHILSAPWLNPKQVVRNVESALCAGLGLVVDRRIISVAQMRPDSAEGLAPASQAPSSTSNPVASIGPGNYSTDTAPTGPAGTAVSRIVFVGFDARHQATTGAVCEVTIQRQERPFTGLGHGPATPQGRATAAARALFAAIATARADDEFGLEGVAIVETQGRTYAFVVARTMQGRRFQTLTGVALVQRSPEEAAILASLQALNRWSEAGY